MIYVYFIRSLRKEGYLYTGYTNNLQRRLEEHNSSGSTLSTANYRPLELIAYVAVANEKCAVNLEKYFKTGSGRAFFKKHFIDR